MAPVVFDIPHQPQRRRMAHQQAEQITVFHGTTVWRIHTLFSGTSSMGDVGLYVTDTAERAQLYADAGATQVVEDRIRRAPGSAVVELETSEPIVWSRRPDNHPTLDKCEATIQQWTISQVTVYTTAFDVTASRTNLGTTRSPHYVSTFAHLREHLGDKLVIIEVEIDGS